MTPAPPGRQAAFDPLFDSAQRAATGDREALESLMKQLQPAFFRAAGSILGARHSALEDVVQEAMLRFIRSLSSFRGDCAVRTFAGTVATRTAVDHVRKERSRLRVVDTVGHDPSLQPAAQPSIESQTVLRRITEVLLDRVSPVQAEALVLRSVMGCSVKEIAASQDVPLETVRSRLRMARRALDEALSQDPKLAEALAARGKG